MKELFPDYREHIGSVEKAIAGKFGLPALMSAEVKEADLIMLATERRDLNLDDGTPWQILVGIEPAPFTLSPLNPQ